MVVTLRFRPVVLGPTDQPAAILFLTDGPDGQAIFRELEFALPLAVGLEAVTVNDLPEEYHGKEVAVLPLQQVTGDTSAEAFRRLQDALRNCVQGRDTKGVA